MSFDYPNTCPDIDDNKYFMQGEFLDFIEELITEFSPMIDTDRMTDLAEERAEKLYEKVESYVEEIRDTNISMRDAAECQMEVLEERIEELEKEVKDD